MKKYRYASDLTDAELGERLRQLYLCESECEGRCQECPQDIANEAAQRLAQTGSGRFNREKLVRACHEAMQHYVLEGPGGMAMRIEAAMHPKEDEQGWTKGPIPEDGSVKITDVEVRGFYCPEDSEEGSPMPFNYTHWRKR